MQFLPINGASSDVVPCNPQGSGFRIHTASSECLQERERGGGGTVEEKGVSAMAHALSLL
eukprot:1138432-Pelagomonas_calceolata.AAC.6